MSALSETMSGVLANGTNVDIPRYSQIEGRIWVGGRPRVQAPRDFKNIVNLTSSADYMLHPLQAQLFFPMFGQPPLGALSQILAIISVMERNGPVLIHCSEGLNRGPFLAALFLMRRGHEPAAAVELMKAKRSAHVFQDKTYETYLLGLNREDLKWE